MHRVIGDSYIGDSCIPNKYTTVIAHPGKKSASYAFHSACSTRRCSGCERGIDANTGSSLESAAVSEPAAKWSTPFTSGGTGVVTEAADVAVAAEEATRLGAEGEGGCAWAGEGGGGRGGRADGPDTLAAGCCCCPGTDKVGGGGR